MRDNKKYFPVNWIDGMKINKSHFIDQDNAWTDALQQVASLHLSPVKYGILPPSVDGDDTFNVKISFDNQNTLRVSVLSCKAVTPGGVSINLPSPVTVLPADSGNILTATFPFSSANSEAISWVFLFVHPFEKQTAGSPDIIENPPRFPIVLPTYTIQLVTESEYRQYAQHPYGIPIGKVFINGNDIKVDEEYIPPCVSLNANDDLVSLHSELDKYLADLELYCSQIVQKIFKKDQKNEISELVMFLCDRVILHLSQAITNMRFTVLYEPPVVMFAGVSALARAMKNTIDMRIGSGKDELMNYLAEWCELNQGELEGMLENLANSGFIHNDVNRNIQKIVVFVKVTLRLFQTLSELEFIGKRKKGPVTFVNEESVDRNLSQAKAKRRFLG
ncbi:MAG: type VI secretion system baseplate subunit TssK [Ginsengibacter sp.]